MDLFEATKIATENGRINNCCDEDLVTQVIDILETHPVREVNYCPYELEQPINTHIY